MILNMNKQIKQQLKKQGFCTVYSTVMTLKEANDFAAANNLLLFPYNNRYLFRVNTIQEEFQKIEKREHYRHANQHVLFTVLATVFFLILWLNLFNI